MKHFLVFAGFYFFYTTTTYAQNQTPNSTTQGQTLNRPTSGSTQNQVLTFNPPQNQQQSYDFNDPYLGRKYYFDRMFISGSAPADFPKYSKDLSLDQYNGLIKTYLQFNSDLLTEKFRKKYSR